MNTLLRTASSVTILVYESGSPKCPHNANYGFANDSFLVIPQLRSGLVDSNAVMVGRGRGRIQSPESSSSTMWPSVRCYNVASAVPSLFCSHGETALLRRCNGYTKTIASQGCRGPLNDVVARSLIDRCWVGAKKYSVPYAQPGFSCKKSGAKQVE